MGEFARQLYAGTQASAVLAHIAAHIADDEIDRDLHDRVVQTALPGRPRGYLTSLASESLNFLYSPSVSPASKPSRTRRTTPAPSATKVDGMRSEP